MGLMGLPAQERFTLENVADKWGTSVPHVEEMVRTLKFKYIIVDGEIIGGSPLTRHLYFDQAFWPKEYDERDDSNIIGPHVRRTYYNIGPNEVANLWPPFHPSKQWERPKKEVVIFIPRVALEAFEGEHDIRPDSVPAQKAKKKDKSPALDPSEIKPDGWYGTAWVARALGMNKKYVQNNISDIIRSRKLMAKRQGVHSLVQGKSLRDSMQKNDSES